MHCQRCVALQLWPLIPCCHADGSYSTQIPGFPVEKRRRIKFHESTESIFGDIQWSSADSVGRDIPVAVSDRLPSRALFFPATGEVLFCTNSGGTAAGRPAVPGPSTTADCHNTAAAVHGMADAAVGADTAGSTRPDAAPACLNSSAFEHAPPPALSSFGWRRPTPDGSDPTSLLNANMFDASVHRAPSIPSDADAAMLALDDLEDLPISSSLDSGECPPSNFPE